MQITAEKQVHAFILALDEWNITEAKALYEQLETIQLKDNAIVRSAFIRYFLLVGRMQDAEAVFQALEKDGLSSYQEYLAGALVYQAGGRYQLAIHHFELAQQMIGADWPPAQKTAYFHELAFCYQQLHFTMLALVYAKRGIAEAEQQSQLTRRQLELHLLIGDLCTEMEQYREAEHCYLAAMMGAEQLHDEQLQIRIFLRSGELHVKEQRLMKGIALLEKAAASRIPEERARAFYHLADAYYQLGNKAEARLAYSEAIKLTEEQELMGLWHMLRMLFVRREERTKFEVTYRAAIHYYRSHKQWNWAAFYAEELANYYRKQKNFRQSDCFFTIAMQARASSKQLSQLA